MARYLAKRLAQALLMLLGLLVLVFALVRLTGDPVTLLAPRDATPEQQQQIREAYGLDRPVAVQFVDFLAGAARLDFGDSIRYRESVTTVALERMPATIELGLVALAIAVGVGVPLGVLAAMKAGSRTDGAARGFALLGQTVPDFWFSLVLILLFAVTLQWFPPFGRDTVSFLGIDVVDRSIVLPAVALSLFPMAQILRFTRAAVLEVVTEEYVRVARAKGMGTWAIYTRFIGRNALIPLISVMSLQVGALISGSLYIEFVFAWPGAGGLLAEAVSNRDFPLIQGLALLGGVITIVFSVLADVLYRVADPRIRLDGDP